VRPSSGAAPSTWNRLPLTPSDFTPCGSPKPVRKTSLAPLPVELNCSYAAMSVKLLFCFRQSA
jgi:hypothetical protein